MALVVDDDVGGFDIAVHNALFVSSLQSRGDLLGDAECFRNLQRSLLDALVEAFTFDELHGDEAAAFGLIDFVDAADVWVAQCSCGLSFTIEALPGFFILQEVCCEEFQRNRAAELGVFGLVDNPHPAPPQFGEDLVVADRAADHDGHIVALRDTWW